MRDDRPARHLSVWIADRRTLLLGSAAAGAAALVSRWTRALATAAPDDSSFVYAGLDHVITAGHRVARGYRAEVLLRWGDPICGDVPFTPSRPAAAAQRCQFGFNNDYIAYLPLPRGGANSDHGLLWVNHEYPDPRLMFPGWSAATRAAALVEVMMEAVGGSVVEVKRERGRWRVVAGSRHARRITANTPIRVSGPAAAKVGTPVIGTFANCGGGKTPWGTVLTAEENIQDYFGGVDESGRPAAQRWQHGSASAYGWELHDSRFDGKEHPRAHLGYGWVVEVDPYVPDAQPVKRTALGRFKHEAATCVVVRERGGEGAWQYRVVVYSGDDQPDNHLYRFVSRPTSDPADPVRNRDLLDHGVLSVARFDASGVDWLPLQHGIGPLIAANGFADQADVLLDVRRAATLLGATPMDRPEDVETNPVSGRVYVMLTNNSRRAAPGPANPRPGNRHGHIVELLPPGFGVDADHTASRYGWNVLLLGGDPSDPESGARYHPDSEVWLSCPDNCAFDPDGRLWIATDQGAAQAGSGIPDGIYTCDVEGRGRALVKLFFAGPRGSELTGPEFTPDGKTLFVSVQHPGEGSTFAAPSTRWPDFSDELPPRPSVVVITKEEDDGRILGS